MGKFHTGEIAVQEQAGVHWMARRVGNGIGSEIYDAAAAFLQTLPLVIVASRDASHQVWASILTGSPGFLEAISATTLRIAATPQQGDPLAENLQPGTALGLLAIDFASRLRMRLNGTLTRHDSSALYLDMDEVYGNCKKYIQARPVTGIERAAPTLNEPARAWRGAALTAEQQTWISQADTFFIASAHPGGSADASHRGGNPGFIHVLNEHHLIFPDYSGNMMFNTLGNITVNPSAGLLFLDFETGSTLQLTGHAAILWDPEQVKAFPGAERLVAFTIHEAIERTDGPGLRFGAPEYSRFNPR